MCVCVYQEQSVLGLEVEVISLIGTLPFSLLLARSLSQMMLFSALSSLPCYLSQSLSFSLFSLLNSITPLVICPFSFHTCFLQQAVCDLFKAPRE